MEKERVGVGWRVNVEGECEERGVGVGGSGVGAT